ncbi:protein STRUBBELIG-RECEPTOR FAMILY 8-like [Andrographis paniculata]|uniref:protein STRUBBELIG-RECEPTOR FAMILY 8-like n=1 Tax=Andrographis paniculata TaxID=175694 RepID=UPI0021E785DF|nr:protein STRUBBELIG-RECEPTOR FAMILY 8-like [Andrographis paniculata]
MGLKLALASYRVLLTEVVVIAAVMFRFCAVIDATTDPNDVQGLQVLYTSLNSPSQLTGWKSTGGDPCGESWKGVTCQGSSVVSIQISGLRLNGTMGYLLSNFASLKTLDLSDNNIHDAIPFQLPPNLTSLNIGSNNLSGGLPYSILNMGSLNYLNASRNAMSQSVGDMFANHSALATIDISFNNFSGDLPPSLASLTNLSTLLLQNNQLTGSLNALADLPLEKLNVANNKFTGWIPPKLLSIPNFVYNGNAFSNGPAPPPPPYTPPPPGQSHNNGGRNHPSGRSPGTNVPSNSQNENKNGLSTGAIVGIVLGSLFAVALFLLLLVFCLRRGKKKESAVRLPRMSLPVSNDKATMEMQEIRPQLTATVSDLKPPPAEAVTVERLQGKNGSVKKVISPITATSYTVAALQTATNSFSQDNLIGEGSLGRVYRAEFANGKVMAIKKIDNAALSLQDEDNFLEAVSNMSHLRHPNIVALVGYCAEHGQRLLVHDYIANGSLHDILHFADERSRMLTWNARVRVALGTARALEYLHEVCLPSVIHRNLKSANILLDEELNPHLSDCGLAALTPNLERQVSSTQMVGSFGYSAPEFTLSGIYTVKSDVYSFGVVMLELLTGRKPLDSSRARSEQSLVRWATPQLHDIDALSKMVDPALNGMYPAKSLSRFADIIALCVQPEPEFRPPMSEVVQALVRLMQRASIVTRRSSEDATAAAAGGFSFKTPEHEAGGDGGSDML